MKIIAVKIDSKIDKKVDSRIDLPFEQKKTIRLESYTFQV